MRRKFMLVSTLMVLSALLVNGNRVHSQDPDSPKDEPKVEKPKDEKPKDDEKKLTDDEKKEKAEKEKKAKADKLSKAYSKLEVDGKALVIKAEFFEFLATYNVVTLEKKGYKVYGYMAPTSKTGLGGEAHCGKFTGYLGTSNGWAVFGSNTTGSGLGLKKPTTVIFTPQTEDGSFGKPVILEGEDTGNGWAYLGDGPGTYAAAVK